MLRTLPFLLAAPALPAIAQTPAAPIPIQSFVKQEQFSQPRLSPDGKHLAVTVRMPIGARDVPTMTFYSLPDLKIESVVRLPAFQVPLDYYWVSNTRLVVRKGHEQGSREIPASYGEVLAMEFDGKKQEYLYGYDRFLNSARTSGYQDDYGICRHRRHSGQRQRPGVPVRLPVADRFQRAARCRYRQGQPALRGTGAAPIVPVPRAERRAAALRDRGGRRRQLHAAAPRRQQRPVAAGTARKNRHAAAPDRVFGGRPRIHGVALAARRTRSTGHGRTWQRVRRIVASDRDGTLSALMYGTSPYLPIAAFTTVGVPQVRYLEPDGNADVALHRQIAAQFPGNTVRFIDSTADGAKLLFIVHSDRDPGTYYLFDRKNGRADMLFAAMESLEPDQMAERKPISFKARDGLQLHGYLTLPRQPAPGKLPLVLIPHGGPHGPYDSWYFDTDAQFLANRGYAVLQVNFRGSGGRGETFRESGFRQWRGKIIDDLVDGVRWAGANANVAGDRMCVYGASFGGYAALTLASREPSLFKCAIGYAGIYDIKLLYEEDEAKRTKSLASLYRTYVGDDVKELDRISPALQAATIKAPVLLIHGGKDKIAPKEHAFRMRDALAKAGRPPEWYYVDYEWHGFYDTENQIEVYRRLEAFLAKHLGK